VKPASQDYIEKANRALKAAKRDLDAGDAGNSISRSYYACFHAATAALNEEEAEARSHRGTHDLFYRLFVETETLRKAYADTLSRLMAHRTEADYARRHEFTLDEAKKDLQRARSFVEGVTSFLQSGSSP
jgi:uncharacterized protein (UPF0332 family)